MFVRETIVEPSGTSSGDVECCDVAAGDPLIGQSPAGLVCVVVEVELEVLDVMVAVVEVEVIEVVDVPVMVPVAKGSWSQSRVVSPWWYGWVNQGKSRPMVKPVPKLPVNHDRSTYLHSPHYSHNFPSS